MSRRTILLGILGALLLSSYCWAEPITVASTQTPEVTDTVYITQPPPAVIAEARPPAPNPAAAWIGGYWRWQINTYVWQAGHWEQKPQGAWVPGHWVKRQRGHVWVAGYWTAKSPKSGKAWVTGHWAKHKGTQVWVAGHWGP